MWYTLRGRLIPKSIFINISFLYWLCLYICINVLLFLLNSYIVHSSTDIWLKPWKYIYVYINLIVLLNFNAKKKDFQMKLVEKPHIANPQGLVMYIDHLMAISQSLFTFFKLKLIFELWAKEPKVLLTYDFLHLNLSVTNLSCGKQLLTAK